jgi:hypothetical protein
MLSVLQHASTHHTLGVFEVVNHNAKQWSVVYMTKFAVIHLPTFYSSKDKYSKHEF